MTRGRPRRRASSSLRLYCPWMPRTKPRSFLLLSCDSLAIGLLPRLASLAENLFVQLHPLAVLVERDARVDELERQLVERRVDFPVRRHEVALREDLLAFLADLEVVEQHRGVRVRGAARHPDSVRPRDRRADGEPVDRRALALELFGLVIVYGQRERHLTRHDALRAP